MTQRGGPRPGSGRPKGSQNRATALRQAEVAASGLTPLAYLLDVMRNSEDDARRLDAAKAAAPYVHPKLSTVDTTITGPNGGPIQLQAHADELAALPADQRARVRAAIAGVLEGKGS